MNINTVIIVILLAELCVITTGCTKRYITISEDITNSTNLDINAYEDLRFPAQIIKVTGASNIPSDVAFVGGTQTLSFSGTSMNQAFLSMQLPHNRKDNSTLYPHFHWSASSRDVGNVSWCIEYTCANIDAIFPPTRQNCTYSPSSLIENKHIMSDMIPISNTLNASAMCEFRIFRNATDPKDTYGANAYLLEFDVHYIIDKFGGVTNGIN